MDEYNDKPQFDVVERSELPAIIKVIGVVAVAETLSRICSRRV